MMYSPAVRMTCFSRDEEHREDRKKALFERLGILEFLRSDPHELASFSFENERWSWSLLDTPHGLPLFEFHLFVSHIDGKHENVCLDAEHSLVDSLLHGRVIDVAEFSRGLPKMSSGWFEKKYEPGFISGTRSFVALALMKAGIFPGTASIAVPMQNLLKSHWAMIEGEGVRVSLIRAQWREFEIESSKLSIFSAVDEYMRAAAERL